jgi:hypothetical protein
MSIKQRLLNAISAHPKLAALGIGLAITMTVATSLGIFEVQTAAASVQQNQINFGMDP